MMIKRIILFLLIMSNLSAEEILFDKDTLSGDDELIVSAELEVAASVAISHTKLEQNNSAEGTLALGELDSQSNRDRCDSLIENGAFSCVEEFVAGHKAILVEYDLDVDILIGGSAEMVIEYIPSIPSLGGSDNNDNPILYSKDNSTPFLFNLKRVVQGSDPLNVFLVNNGGSYTLDKNGDNNNGQVIYGLSGSDKIRVKLRIPYQGKLVKKDLKYLIETALSLNNI
jgi:hypothetical protein